MPRKAADSKYKEKGFEGTWANSTPTKPAVDQILDESPQALISEYFRLDDWLKNENKRFADHMKPTKDRMEAITNKLHEKLVALGGDDKANISTDAGTAYISTILNVAVDPEAEKYVDPQDGHESTGREALIDFALANWSEYNDLLLVQPAKDAVRRHMEEHDGRPPPGIRIGWFKRVNLRRS